MNEVAKERTPQEIAVEINVIKHQTMQTVAAASFQIGKRLCEAKALVPAGEWLDYLQTQLDYKPTTAENLMRIYKEFGDEQMDLLTGKSPAELFGGLNQSQMVAMFALPMESRKELLEDNPDLPEMSARDVQRLVKEKQAAEKERDRERTQRERAEKLATTQADRADRIEAALKKAEEEREQLKSQTSMIQADTTGKDNEIAELKAQLEDLKSRPDTEFTEEEKEKIRQEAKAEAAAEIEKATKKASASQVVQQINFAFREIQRQFETVETALTECEKKEPKTAERLKNVIATTLSMLAGKVEKL